MNFYKWPCSDSLTDPGSQKPSFMSQTKWGVDDQQDKRSGRVYGYRVFILPIYLARQNIVPKTILEKIWTGLLQEKYP